jgi:sugar-specific transcriptional regulator TrmB
LSLEVLINTLVDFGFKRTDVQIYAFLAKKGPQRGKDLARALKITRQKVYRSLKKLQRRGIVNSTINRPAVFSAVSVEEVRNMFIKNRIEETRHLIQNNEEFLSSWRSITEKDSRDSL